MRIKKTRFSTMISDLYGRNDYQKAIKVGREYWWNWPANSTIGELYGSGWYKMKVTYIRSHCMFYIFSDYPDVPEQFCGFDCFLASSLVLADLNPRMDLPFISEEGVDLCQQMYCFDDTRTIIHNWDNSRECDIDEEKFMKEYPSYYITVMSQNLDKLNNVKKS